MIFVLEDGEQIEGTIELLKKAERPLLVAGNGVRIGGADPRSDGAALGC